MIYVSQTPLLTLSEPKKPVTDNALECASEWRLRHLADNIFFQAKRWKDVGSIKANMLAWTFIKPKGAAFIQAFPACEGHLAVSHIRLYPSKLLFSGGQFFAGKWVSERDRFPDDGSYFVTSQFFAYPPPPSRRLPDDQERQMVERFLAKRGHSGLLVAERTFTL